MPPRTNKCFTGSSSSEHDKNVGQISTTGQSNVGSLEKFYSFDLVVLNGVFHTLRKQTTNSTMKCC
jgi:hypothetical protein